MIDKTCPCRSSYEHSQRYFWTLTPKKGLLSCQLTFFRLVVTMAESFCLCTTANGAHAHLIYAEDNILWFIFTRGWSVFNTGGGSTLNIFKQKLSTSTTSNRLSLLECPELPSPLYSAVQSVVLLHFALERRQRWRRWGRQKWWLSRKCLTNLSIGNWVKPMPRSATAQKFNFIQYFHQIYPRRTRHPGQNHHKVTFPVSLYVFCKTSRVNHDLPITCMTIHF